MDFTIFSLWNLDLTFPFRKQVLNTFIPAPEEVSAYAIVSLAAGRGEGGSIRARSSPDLVEEGRGSDKGLTYDRFDDLDGPGESSGDGQRQCCGPEVAERPAPAN
jgi:hypothetical protein